jgi:hypothetical protein
MKTNNLKKEKEKKKRDKVGGLFSQLFFFSFKIIILLFVEIFINCILMMKIYIYEFKVKLLAN